MFINNYIIISTFNFYIFDSVRKKVFYLKAISKNITYNRPMAFSPKIVILNIIINNTSLN